MKLTIRQYKEARKPTEHNTEGTDADEECQHGSACASLFPINSLPVPVVSLCIATDKRG